VTATTKLITLRTTEEVRDLIDRGAAAVYKSRSEFILEASAMAAQDALLDRTYLALSPMKMADFLQIMERPVGANLKLSALLTTPAPWDRSDPSVG
jgi:uncharacterized protein (DUF1778 family)